jgi:DNA-binding beta-propeller fold protein YncE
MLDARSLLPLVLLLCPLSLLAQAPPDGHTIEGLAHPESVALDAANEVFYAANIGAKMAPSAKDGDGTIARLAPDGSVDTAQYLPAPSGDATLHAPKGTVVLDGRLYTADIDRVVGFDLGDRSKIAEVSLADQGVSFLNDIAVMNDQMLLASGSNQGRIYRIDLEAGTATALDVEIPGVNGLAYAASEGVLYAVNFGGDEGGQLWTLTLTADGAVEDTASRTLVEGGRFDGVVLRPDNRILISDWGVAGASDPTPALHRVAAGGTGAVATIELPEWQGPADFDCSAARGCWIPDLPASVMRVVRPGERMGN